MRRPFQVLVLGTGSHVGKSLVAAGLCRLLARRGWRTAPFKAQNMALNSAVADDGSEIGRAQWLQARAARVPSEARMNPVLLKPDGKGSSQWVLLGRSRGSFATREYFRRCWPEAARRARESWAGLARDYDAVVLEGAGSPAEVNLSRRDLANLEAARFSRSPFVLVADVERGGAFAAVVGTLDLLPAWLRRRCLGVVFNKFRGDASLMDAGLAWLRRRGIRPLGILPWVEALALDEEDSLGLPSGKTSPDNEKSLLVDVISNRFIANFNDVLPLAQEALRLRWVRPGQERSQADLVILPGSKNTVEDLRILRESGEAERLLSWRRRGTWFLGICGGFQMLGRRVEDPWGLDGPGGGAAAQGLGFLPVATRLEPGKVLSRRRVPLARAWGGSLEGYEIHHGRTRKVGSGLAVEAVGPDGEALLARPRDGRIWGTYLHGCLDAPGLRTALLAAVARGRGRDAPGPGAGHADALRELALDRWADHLERHLDLGFLPAPRGAPE